MVSSASDFITVEQAQSLVKDSCKRITVYCGSASNLKPIYHTDAALLGKLIGENNCSLIYGGGNWGLMGEVARSALSHGAKVVGVLPGFMRSTSGDCHGKTILVEGMAERKNIMDTLAEVFVALPGGFGTLDEVTEMLTWNQIGFNNKLIGFLNTDGFYNDFWNWIQKALKEGMIRVEHLKNVFIADTPMELMNELLSRAPIEVPAKFRTKA